MGVVVRHADDLVALRVPGAVQMELAVLEVADPVPDGDFHRVGGGGGGGGGGDGDGLLGWLHLDHRQLGLGDFGRRGLRRGLGLAVLGRSFQSGRAADLLQVVLASLLGQGEEVVRLDGAHLRQGGGVVALLRLGGGLRGAAAAAGGRGQLLRGGSRVRSSSSRLKAVHGGFLRVLLRGLAGGGGRGSGRWRRGRSLGLGGRRLVHHDLLGLVHGGLHHHLAGASILGRLRRLPSHAGLVHDDRRRCCRRRRRHHRLDDVGLVAGRLGGWFVGVGLAVGRGGVVLAICLVSGRA